MKTIVLDLSGLRSATPNAFEVLSGRYRFLLTDKLFLELYTHSDKGESYSKHRASQQAHSHLLKLPEGHAIQLVEDPQRYEVEQGMSGQTAPYRELTRLELLGTPSDDDIRGMFAQERLAGQAFSFERPVGFEQEFKELRARQNDKDLWPWIADYVRTIGIIEYLRNRAIHSFMEMANRQDWQVSNNFCPDTDWLTYGIGQTVMAYWAWKYARHGDGVPEPKKPANPAWDMTYVSYIALTEGLLSNDVTMLNIAWSCYPDKRRGLLTFDPASKAIVQYRPKWEL